MKKIIISACLVGEICRYDGKSKPMDSDILENLKEKYELIPVCPEVAGGLETPRKPCEICGERVMTADGEDFTDEYTKGAVYALESAKKNGVEICILKSKSPSCGINGIYDGSFTRTLTKGMGITAKLLSDNGITVYDETDILKLIN